MIIVEKITIDGKEYTRTYSDTFLIRKIGTEEIYVDAVDVLDYKYEETKEPLPAVEKDKDIIIAELRAELETYKRSTK